MQTKTYHNKRMRLLGKLIKIVGRVKRKELIAAFPYIHPAPEAPEVSTRLRELQLESMQREVRKYANIKRAPVMKMKYNGHEIIFKDGYFHVMKKRFRHLSTVIQYINLWEQNEMRRDYREMGIAPGKKRASFKH